ncbi:MAG: hypothetical protein A2898_03480 [Candidatus Kerfeldbacteria bacterium RIFCSPLOWO2_01_FULL_48_11]|uniref:Putative pterin-4-alpha-carbinolamine dehydratase n=1 Tax=Candidatus Kerfeldbacteria bacterium RIFCSPLOWO2_01_FULL_48_11 TaxID=1798543 RepID=A0A1G2B2A5_9BACT|nr:MAG: hypothetical protein UY52_C0007G0013 [Parcubacteria group bacterium GW2011_GWC2_49_9]OGY83323.1 MAG: hypothetical protein A2898_03480 [Candidatus Kerfeldbacteria bacterium RIFCSPLOWO2_01_FULL_48_11]HCJ52132.1 4a-hydroxytetrahydrobiopterin dehydratase [Candidatus Kerfeldbacteria bacterium]
MSEDLRKKRCIPCEGGIPPLANEEIAKLMPQVLGWHVVPVEKTSRTMDTLQKTFQFKNFREAMAFLRRIEDLAESEGHHPDFYVHYNRVDFTIWTHAIGGLHENDFILASKIDQLLENT